MIEKEESRRTIPTIKKFYFSCQIFNAIYNSMKRSESTYYRFKKSKIGGYRVHS
jgi:hypothetical protein